MDEYLGRGSYHNIVVLSSVSILTDFMGESKANKANEGNERGPRPRNKGQILGLVQMLSNLTLNISSFSTVVTQSPKVDELKKAKMVLFFSLVLLLFKCRI